MSFKVIGRTEDIFKGYSTISGLEGPFIKGYNRVVYYDPREGKYWDPKTDFYLTNEEVRFLDEQAQLILSN